MALSSATLIKCLEKLKSVEQSVLALYSSDMKLKKIDVGLEPPLLDTIQAVAILGIRFITNCQQILYIIKLFAENNIF